MRTIGGKTKSGKTYAWRGKKIRTVKYGGKLCVTMPRKESMIIAPAKINNCSLYKVIVTACNKGGNGKISVGFDDKVSEDIYIVSSNFKKHRVDIYTDGIFESIRNLVVSRPPDSSGSVVIKNIAYDEIERPKTEEELKLEQENKEREKKLEKRKELGKLQAEESDRYREEQSKKIIATRGDTMGKPTIIGGKGFRWVGKNIRSVFKYGTTCAILKGNGSILLVPVSVPQQTSFTVDIKASGNCSLLVNFFGGRKFDGPQAKLKIKNEQIKKYSVKTETPKFPANSKMYLRVWIPSNSGSVCIKEISYTKINKKKTATKEPKKTKPRVRRPNVPKKEHKPKEFYDMKFKPYNFTKASDRAKEVLMSRPEQVPLVSIITPTRDGINLLTKCYNALDKNTAYPNWEWIIGDSESKDGTADYIKSLNDPRIKLVERGTIDGSFSTINNELTEYAGGEYYLFLNDDTEPQSFWLYEMMSKIHEKNSIGAVGAKLMHGESRIQHAGIMLTPSGPGNLGKPLLKAFGGPGFADKDRFYQAVTGACLLMRAKDFKKVKGFDPIYHFCYEDVDLCLKIKYDLNKKILYAANAVVFHVESATQKKYGTGGKLQKEGIAVFKKRWMRKVEIDMPKFRSNPQKGVQKIDVSFVTCINNVQQYARFVVGPLFLNGTNKNYEIIPIFNTNNRYSAAQALNIGINKARGDIIVLCHQDVLFFKGWVDLMFERIGEIGHNKWGVLGTAGITERDKTVGAVYNLKGRMQWRQSAKGKVSPVQTVDEHCMIIRKNSGLKFDEKVFNGFHCYGPDICLNAISRGMKNFGILCPLVHDSGSGSLGSGRKEFMRLLQALSKKWGKKFKRIRTSTSSIKKGKIRTFIHF
jgi:GT2 family glycosyltransferase